MSEAINDLATLDDLRDYRWIQVEYEQLLEEYERLKAHIERCTSDPTPQYSTGGVVPNDKIGGYLARMEQLLERIEAKLFDKFDRMECCERTLDLLPQPYQIVMKLYYINCMTFHEIAVRVDYSYEHCRRLAVQARTMVNQLATQCYT